MRRNTSPGRCAERVLVGVDDAGREERVVIWLERRQGGVWAVNRAVDPHLRRNDELRGGESVFEGYELGDALEAANAVLEDDVSVLEGDGARLDVKPFTRKEVLPFLERYFFGRG